MKKWLYGILSVLGLAIIAGAAYFVFFHHSDVEKADSKVEINKNDEKKQTASIAGVKTDLGINGSSTEEAVVEVLHEMTHQKVKASEKWGAIEMNKANIDSVTTIVKNSSFEDRDRMLDILSRWKKGNFSTVVEDHNFFWGLQGGNIGKAYGKMSQKEEEAFIKNNFNGK